MLVAEHGGLLKVLCKCAEDLPNNKSNVTITQMKESRDFTV
jgi:hypothetical protein